VVQDPAAGTGGFLVLADRYIKKKTDDFFDLSEQQQMFQKKTAFNGAELVPDTHRLLLMNMLLHDIEGPMLLADTLSPSGQDMPRADLILANPPFGTKTGGGRPTRDDFTFPTGNKQLAFLQHIYRGLKPGRPSSRKRTTRATWASVGDAPNAWAASSTGLCTARMGT
jgi:type I restriction enzyme M protein